MDKSRCRPQEEGSQCMDEGQELCFSCRFFVFDTRCCRFFRCELPPHAELPRNSKAMVAGQTQPQRRVRQFHGRRADGRGRPIKAVEVWHRVPSTCRVTPAPRPPTLSNLNISNKRFEVRVQQLREKSAQRGLEALTAQQILKFWQRGFSTDSRIPEQSRSLFSDFEASGTKKPSSLSPIGEGIPPDA